MKFEIELGTHEYEELKRVIKLKNAMDRTKYEPAEYVQMLFNRWFESTLKDERNGRNGFSSSK
jgi:hypothetical protein